MNDKGMIQDDVLYKWLWILGRSQFYATDK